MLKVSGEDCVSRGESVLTVCCGECVCRCKNVAKVLCDEQRKAVSSEEKEK